MLIESDLRHKELEEVKRKEMEEKERIEMEKERIRKLKGNQKPVRDRNVRYRKLLILIFVSDERI